jgi:hypothetical protein
LIPLENKRRKRRMKEREIGVVAMMIHWEEGPEIGKGISGR